MSQDPAASILVVCTANQCRSPLATALFRSLLAEHGAHVTVACAGTRAAAGIPATKETIDVAVQAGLDISAHRSAFLDENVILDADLVVGMERGHVREMVTLVPSAWPRAFTLKELARRGLSTGPRRAGEPIAAWVARVHAGRRPGDLLGSSRDDDIEDPSGNPLLDHQRLYEELEVLVRRVVSLVWPAPDRA
jgi:protein-tyrosine phosphatase